MTCPRWLESVSTSGDVAVTSTFSVTWPTGICRSTRRRAPTCTCDVVHQRHREARLLGGDDIDARVAPPGTRNCRRRSSRLDDGDAGPGAGQRDLRPGHDRAGGVADGADHRGGVELRERGSDASEQEEGEPEKEHDNESNARERVIECGHMDVRVWGLRDRRANQVQQQHNVAKNALMYDEGESAATISQDSPHLRSVLADGGRPARKNRRHFLR